MTGTPSRKLRFEIMPISGELAREGVHVRAVWTKGRRRGSLAAAEKVRKRLNQLLSDAGYMTAEWEK